MPVNRPVTREDEPIEFRPIPGQEEEWAGMVYWERSRLWDWLGVYPIGWALVATLVLIGAAL